MRLGRPISRILLYPAIHLRGIPGLPEGAAPTSPEGPDNLACSHRWFTWPVPRGMPPVGSYPTLSPITCAEGRPHGHRLVCSLLHLTWRRACAYTAAQPYGSRRRRPSGCWPERPLLRVRTLLYVPGEGPGTQRRVGRPEPTRIIPYRLYAWLRAPYGATASDEHDPGRREA
jgi:hypothetical protein